VLHQEEDLNRCITHITEAILLHHRPFQSSQDVVCGLNLLASNLLSRFSLYNRPEDLKSSLKYFRHLRCNFLSFGAFHFLGNRLVPNHLWTLARYVLPFHGVVDEKEMAAECLELLASDDLTKYTRDAMFDFSIAVGDIFRRGDANQPSERLIDALRDVTTRKPDWVHASFALAHCLSIRFQMTHGIDIYEEAITTTHRIVASNSPGDSFTPTRKLAIGLIVTLITDRFNFYARPEYLVESIDTLQILRDLPSLPERLYASITELLGQLKQRYRVYFGAIGKPSVAPSNTSVAVHNPLFSPTRAEFRQTVELAENDESEMEKRAHIVLESLIAIRNNEPTDIEETVKYGRTLVPSPHSRRRSPILPVSDLAEFLSEAYRHTSSLNYLDEAIVTFRHVLHVPGTNIVHFQVAKGLFNCIDERWKLFHEMQDFEEMMSLFSAQVNCGSEVAFRRFRISCRWASEARAHTHPCTFEAYENAVSLMQETLVFSPTLQSQYDLLVEALAGFEGIPLDYVSYRIERWNLEEAVRTLERGRTLLWSEMRGFRTSTDQLVAAGEPDLAKKFTDINRELEAVTMSTVQHEEMKLGNDETDCDMWMDAFGDLVLQQQNLLEERHALISQIQTLPSFENFLKPPLFDVLNQAASCGPVIIINQSTWRSDILILLKNSPPSVISTPPNLHDRAKALKDRLLGTRRRYGLDSKDYEDELGSVLADLCKLIGKPVIDRLRELKIPVQSRVWWCPTAAFCSLPLHAMGPIPSDDGRELYFMDLYITSYTTSLSALIESRKPSARDEKFDLPPMLLVALPGPSLPTVGREIEVIKDLSTSLSIPVTTLIGEEATPAIVMEELWEHRFVHIACHGLLDPGKPFGASIELHGDSALTLLDIVRSRLPAAEFAFLSFCHTAELTPGSLEDEGLHMTAALQFCGFRSVIGTSWAMLDEDGEDLSEQVYKSMFRNSLRQQGVPHHERSAKALQYAVRRLRMKRRMTLERWVNFVHYGA
jgi:CHAT domain-containing protein